MLTANSAAILTDAFPIEQRGMALGVNQIAALPASSGSARGGLLAVVDWRAVFWLTRGPCRAGSIGNASVRIAAEFRRQHRTTDGLHDAQQNQPQRPACPVNGSRESASEARLQMRKPRLYMRTRPKMSPSRPSDTTMTAETSR